MCQRQSEIPLMTKEEPFKSALFMGAGRENMAAGRTGSSHRKNTAQRIRSARPNQTEQAVCPQTRCSVTVLRVSNAALDVPTQKESLVRSLICKVQSLLAKVIKATVSHSILSLPLTALISCLPSRCFYAHVLCPTLPDCASMCPFCLTCSGVNFAH